MSKLCFKVHLYIGHMEMGPQFIVSSEKSEKQGTEPGSIEKELL